MRSSKADISGPSGAVNRIGLYCEGLHLSKLRLRGALKMDNLGA